MSAESFMYTPPILSMLVPVSIVSLKHMYVVTMHHRSGSRTVTHMEGGGVVALSCSDDSSECVCFVSSY